MSITVGELIKALSIHDEDEEVYFGGLDFYRVKCISMLKPLASNEN